MSKDKALVLGGGGITGIAWEAGVLAGLIDSGIKMNQVDKILGSSAGSFVGAILANNQNMQAYYQDLATHHSETDNAQLDPAIYDLWTKSKTTSHRSTLPHIRVPNGVKRSSKLITAHQTLLCSL